MNRIAAFHIAEKRPHSERSLSYGANLAAYERLPILKLPPRRILALREKHREAVTSRLGRAAANGHRVLEHLYQRPIMSVGDVRALISTTYPAANNLVGRMVEIGILTEATGNRRNRQFRYQPYIDLFGEHDQPTS